MSSETTSTLFCCVGFVFCGLLLNSLLHLIQRNDIDNNLLYWPFNYILVLALNLLSILVILSQIFQSYKNFFFFNFSRESWMILVFTPIPPWQMRRPKSPICFEESKSVNTRTKSCQSVHYYIINWPSWVECLFFHILLNHSFSLQLRRLHFPSKDQLVQVDVHWKLTWSDTKKLSELGEETKGTERGQ